MTELNVFTVLFLTVLTASFLLTALVVRWSERPWVRGLAVALFIALSGAAYVGFTEALSRAKPIAINMVQETVEEADVLSALIIEDKGIYVTLHWGAEPRLYVFPWDKEFALQLQKAQSEAEENETGVRMVNPFEDSWDNQTKKFYAQPQPKLPEKGGDEGRGVEYKREMES